MRLFWFSLFVFIHSVICTNKSEVQSYVERRYSVNHPPSAEDYNPIPVSVVYEDDVIDMKPRIPNYYDISHDREVEQKVSTEEGQLLAPKEIQSISKNKTEDNLANPTVRSLSELHIPVAVIYDSPSGNSQNLRAVEQEDANARQRTYKRVSRRKSQQNKPTAVNENTTNQSTTKAVLENEGSEKLEMQSTKSVKPQLKVAVSSKPQIENNDSANIETPRTKPVKPLLSRSKSVKPEIENEDYVKSETPEKMKIDNPQLSRTEPSKPQTENKDFNVKSDTQSTKSIKPQLSRSESVKPRKIASISQSQSKIETTTKEQKRKRVRDPVVPIVEMENHVYAHNGNFHYSYEGGDGTKAHSEGQLRSIDETAGEAVSGGFSYTDKDGNDFSLSYTADENGYRPIGAHLPTPPPIPPAIARALAYLATATTPEPVTKPTVKKTGKSL